MAEFLEGVLALDDSRFGVCDLCLKNSDTFSLRARDGRRSYSVVGPIIFLAVPSAPTMVVVSPRGSNSYSCCRVSLRRLLPRPLLTRDMIAQARLIFALLRIYRLYFLDEGDDVRMLNYK